MSIKIFILAEWKPKIIIEVSKGKWSDVEEHLKWIFLEWKEVKLIRK